MALGLPEGTEARASRKDLRRGPLVVGASVSASRFGQPHSRASAIGKAHAPQLPLGIFKSKCKVILRNVYFSMERFS